MRLIQSFILWYFSDVHVFVVEIKHIWSPASAWWWEDVTNTWSTPTQSPLKWTKRNWKPPLMGHVTFSHHPRFPQCQATFPKTWHASQGMGCLGTTYTMTLPLRRTCVKCLQKCPSVSLPTVQPWLSPGGKLWRQSAILWRNRCTSGALS